MENGFQTKCEKEKKIKLPFFFLNRKAGKKQGQEPVVKNIVFIGLVATRNLLYM